MRNTLISQIEKAVRQNFIPGLILWCIGLILVFCFYFLDASRPWFQLVIEWKKQYGFFYSGVSTALFGGVIPYLFLRVSGRGGFGSNWIHGVIFILYWALRGVDVDAFYRFQAWLFGAGNQWQTIFKKVLFDQFVYCVFWATPITALFYEWKDSEFSLSVPKSNDWLLALKDKIIIFMVSTWMVWIPATAIVYSLPSPLQIPLFNLTLCFFVILVSLFEKKDSSGALH